MKVHIHENPRPHIIALHPAVSCDAWRESCCVADTVTVSRRLSLIRSLTQCSWQAPEDETVRVLEEADPSDPCCLPLVYEAGRVQQGVHVAVAVRLRLEHEGVVLFQSQPGLSIPEASHLPNSQMNEL